MKALGTKKHETETMRGSRSGRGVALGNNTIQGGWIAEQRARHVLIFSGVEDDGERNMRRERRRQQFLFIVLIETTLQMEVVNG